MKLDFPPRLCSSVRAGDDGAAKEVMELLLISSHLWSDGLSTTGQLRMACPVFRVYC